MVHIKRSFELIFQHTWQWITKPSPHTGELKTQTSRIAAPEPNGESLAGFEMLSYPMGMKAVVRGSKDDSHWVTKWQVGKTYAVQPGRGEKAIGRIRILDIQRIDVRDFTPADVKREGFLSLNHYLLVWSQMHDAAFHDRYPTTGQISLACEQGALMERPAELYDAWVLKFERVTAS